MTEFLDVVSCLIALQGVYEMLKLYAYPVFLALFDLVRILWLHASVLIFVSYLQFSCVFWCRQPPANPAASTYPCCCKKSI
jgi:hypothetical protein